MSKSQDPLQKAREKRALEKSKAVEQAISTLKEKGEAVTFVSIAFLAKVSRPFLYKNYKKLIESLRQDTRNESKVIEGHKIPSRTFDEYKHIEAVLKNKLYRLSEDLKNSRKEVGVLKQQLERARGEGEHWRRLYTQFKIGSSS